MDVFTKQVTLTENEGRGNMNDLSQYLGLRSSEVQLEIAGKSGDA